MPESAANTFGTPLPVFRVNDVDASITYYRQALGFELRWRAGDAFACVARDQCSIFLTDDNQSQPRMWVWIGVQNIRALYEQYVKSGAKIRNPPENFE
jgi:catechol 2,3-dioxygenase-like lactoylglutathione lyase family enzyme